MLIGSGQFQQGAFTNPQNGQSPIDADDVRDNDNDLRQQYNAHDVSEKLHVQSAPISSRPGAVAANTGGLFVSTDGLRIFISSGSGWDELGYLPLAGGTVTGNVTLSGTTALPGKVASAVLFSADATYDIGAVGADRPRDLFLSGTATVGAVASGAITAGGLLLTTLSGTGGAMFRLPHGAAPSSPLDGDVWTTTAGIYVRVNGATVGPLGAGGGGGGLGGGGTTSRSARWTSATDLGDGSFTDNGTTLTALVPLVTLLSGTSSAGLRLPHGAAPTSPTNGDVWTTTTGLFCRINGSTVGPLGATSGTVSGTGTSGAISKFTGTSSIGDSALVEDATNITSSRGLVLSASTTARASLRVPSGTAPSSPVEGEVWYAGGHLYFRTASSSYPLTVPEAPASVPFVTLGTDATLTSERVLTAGTGISIVDNGAGNTVVISATGSGGVTGSGTMNFLPKWSSSTALTNSLVQDNGTTITLGSLTSHRVAFTARVESHLHFGTDATYDIGASGTTRPRHYYGSGNATAGGNLVIGGTGQFSGKVSLAASGTGAATLNIPSGTAPSSPVDGDVWYDGTGLYIRISGTSHKLLIASDLGSVVTATNMASTIPTARQLSNSGAITLTDNGAGSTVVVGDGT